jgi:hypothetical protein
VKAGILDERKGAEDVVAAIMADRSITERQRQVLAQIYTSFREETETRRARRRRARKNGASAPRKKRRGGGVQSEG